jgi:hypothetical protein
MSIPFPGFCAPSYRLDNKYSAIERCVNWYVTAVEATEEAKGRFNLNPSPGNQPFGPLPVPAEFAGVGRQLMEFRGGVYGVNGGIVFAMNANGNYSSLGAIANDNLPVSMVATGTGQIFICSAGMSAAGFAYVIPNGPEPVVQVPVDSINGPFFGGSVCTFQDGYVLVVTPNSNQFQISGTDAVPLGDATQWQANNVSVQLGQGDLLASIISSRQYLRLVGQRRSQIYWNVGASGTGGFPFVSYNETFIETGIAAPFSMYDFPDSLMWIGQDKNGMRACWRDRAFQPQRVSDFAVEQRWQKYPTVADAVAFGYIWAGHLKYRVTFPTAGASWEYDLTESELQQRAVWNELQFTSPINNAQVRRPELFHCYAFGKHLVLSDGTDGNPGAVYQMGNVGTTNQNPQALLRWSNTGGKTFGNEQEMPVGLIGEDPQQETLGVYYNRTGYARDRVFWLRYAEETECAQRNGVQVRVPQVRDRIAPHLWKNRKRRIYDRIQFEVNFGLGSVDGVTPASESMGIVGAELDLREMAS